MSGDTLILVHTIFRHGARTTDLIFMYPKDPHKNEEFLPYGPGQLTNDGKLEMYELGKILRTIYDKHLGDQYLPKHVKARSTDFDRAKMSLQLVLASLYPPRGQSTWNKDLNWQPIPYFSCKFKDDELLGAVFDNEEFRIAYEEYFKFGDGKSVLEDHKELLDYLRKHAGGDFGSTRPVWLTNATLTTERQDGLILPEWTASVFPEKLAPLAFLEYHSQVATKQLKRLVVGKLMRQILQDTKDKINGISARKIHLYSCHDHNVATTLIFFGLLPQNHFPSYTACVAIEVHKINNDYALKIRYRPSTFTNFQYMIFPSGGDTLKLVEFEKMVQDLFDDSKS